jgi:hypothetical protein
MPSARTATEAELFRECTVISLGNEECTSFWHDKWLQGQAPKDLMTALLKLAWRKNLMVAQAIPQGRWMRGLKRISTTQEIEQFIELWTRINQVQLTDAADDIDWRFTAGGRYSAQSAYAVQFMGSFVDHSWDRLWAAHVENKCKLFCWLFLQNRL